MLGRTHMAFGLLCALIFLPIIQPRYEMVFIGIVVLGSLLPDIDERRSKISRKIPLIATLLSFFVKHRGIFHSLFMALPLSALIWWFSPTSGYALFIGYCSHLVTDGMTVQGVNFLHPVMTLRMKGPLKTGSFIELILFGAIIAGIITKLA